MSPHSANKSYSLHPLLAEALGSLDVSLESELAHYRCHQVVKRLSASPIAAAPGANSSGVTGEFASPGQRELAASVPGPASVDTAPALASNSPADFPQETDIESQHQSATSPEDYLASSQALLDLTAEPPAPRQQRFLTPLGFVALGLLLASFPVAYGIIQSTQEPQPAPRQPSPVKLSPKQTVQATLSPALATPPPAPVPTATPQPPAPAARQSNSYVYVVINSSSPQTLAQVQRVVPEAFVRDFPGGPRIQVGAYDNRQPAQDIVRFLEGQGLSATLWQP